MKTKMIMAVPKDFNIELLDEVILALAKHRYGSDYEELLEPAYAVYFKKDGEEHGKYFGYPRYGNYDKDFYFVDADYVTVELVELIEDVKKIIPLETYFESVAEWDYLSHSHSKETAA